MLGKLAVVIGKARSVSHKVSYVHTRTIFNSLLVVLYAAVDFSEIYRSIKSPRVSEKDFKFSDEYSWLRIS